MGFAAIGIFFDRSRKGFPESYGIITWKTKVRHRIHRVIFNTNNLEGGHDA